jgi:hypothetical protein
MRRLQGRQERPRDARFASIPRGLRTRGGAGGPCQARSFVYREAMRRKRTRTRPAAPASDEHPPDATGLTIDWVGVQATGSGPVSAVEVFVVGGLAALRALPFVAWRAARRRRGQAASTSSSGSGDGPGSGGASPSRDASSGDR